MIGQPHLIPTATAAQKLAKGLCAQRESMGRILIDGAKAIGPGEVDRVVAEVGIDPDEARRAVDAALGNQIPSRRAL